MVVMGASWDPEVCHRKVTYASVYDANRSILIHYRYGSPQLEPYWCRVCGYLHLTRKRVL